MDALQLRLFPAPKPLVERLGAESFRRVPTAPGVCLMAGERERLLYVGKAQNLRQRLNSYRHIQLLGRKRDGQPGVQCLWRGWQRLEDLVLGWQLAQAMLKPEGSVSSDRRYG